jgi:hypothetical protein|tara:strand:- start:494 stop:1264 length:771 start_codon:yes stop_codon:yes gene_type:complete
MAEDFRLVSYGGGTNSTAMLVECVNRGIKVDVVLFADTGGEKPHTYNYIKTFSKWLVENGMPKITIVKYFNKYKELLTLERDCLNRNSLPSLAYGFKSCSQKFKLAPQDKYMNNYQPAKDCWESGGKITKFIGFDAGESHRVKDYSDKKYTVEYPLVDWDMGREECIESIEKAGLCQPGKSACFFCPASKPTEIKQLKATYPSLSKRAIELENQAELTKIKGLGRNFSWKELLATEDMFEEDFLSTPELLCGCYDG